MKKAVKVTWQFAKPAVEVKTKKLPNGQVLPVGPHDFRPEGIPTKKIYCCGCKRYFKNWSIILWVHGITKQKPKGV